MYTGTNRNPKANQTNDQKQRKTELCHHSEPSPSGARQKEETINKEKSLTTQYRISGSTSQVMLSLVRGIEGRFKEGFTTF